MKKIGITTLILLTVLTQTHGLYAASDQTEVHLSVYNLPSAAPSNLVATAVSCSQIDLTWTDNSNNETSFKIEVSPDGSAWLQIGTVGANITSYSAESLSENTTYYYRVRAYNPAGNSDYSNSASAVTSSCVTPPAAPTPSVVQGGGPLTDTTIPGIQYLAVTTTHNSAVVSFKTNESAASILSWGKTLEYEMGGIAEIDFEVEHSILIPNLEPETNYYFKIELRDEVRNLNKIENQKFTTLVMPDLTPPANVSNFEISVVDSTGLKLDWQNPIDPDFSGVRIVKSTKFFPADINDGETIFEGREETLFDKNVLRGTRYYYTIFAYDTAGNYSSGAVASGVIAIPGITPPPEIPPELPPELVPPEIEKINIADFNFFQKGKRLAVVEEKIQVVSDESLEIKLDYQKVPEILKTILVTLVEPGDGERTFSFLLKVNKEKTDYEAVLAPLKKSGIYGVTVSVLDFKNQTLKKIRTTLLVSELEAAITEAVPYTHIYIIIPLIILIFVILAVILRQRKKKMKYRFLTILIITITAITAIVGFGISYAADFNKQINYQGKLTDTSNVAVADGSYHMFFRLADALTGGNVVWFEDRSQQVGDRIQMTSGLFSVLLGSSTALTFVNFNQTLFLEVEICGIASTTCEILSPRKKIGAVPAAFEADKIDGLSSEQFLRSDAVNATSTTPTFLTITQNGAGKIAEFFGPSSASVLSVLSGGNVGIGTTSPYAKLSVWGGTTGNILEVVTNASTTALSVSATGFATTTLTGLNINGSATSTSNVGWNITAGCFAIGGTCITGGSSYTATWPLNITGTVISSATSSASSAGVLSGADWTTFNNKQATISATYPIILTGAVLSFPATSTLYGTGSYGNFLMWNGSPTWTATSTLSLTKSQISDFGTYENPLTFNYPLTRATNAISSALSTTTTNIWNALNTFSNASTTLLSATYASSTLGKFGTLSLTNALTVANGGTGATTLTGLLQGNGTGAITGITGTAGQFPYYNGASTLLATSSIFLATSGNVGIGTTSPYAQLSIHRNASDTSNSPLFSVASSTASATSTLFTILNNGNVGIGTASPAYTLDVSGTAQVAGQNNVLLGDLNPSIVATLSTLLSPHQAVLVGSMLIQTHSAGNGVSIQSFTDPKNPKLLASVSDATELEKAEGVAVSWPYIYVSSQNTGNNRITRFDGDEILKGQSFSNSRMNYVSDSRLNVVRSVALIGTTLFAVSDTTDLSTISAWDVSNPAIDPVFVSQLTLNSSVHTGAGIFMDCDTNYCYVTVDTVRALYVVDITNPSSMSITGSKVSTTIFNGIFMIKKSGNLLYVASKDSNRFSILNVSNPSSPQLIGYTTDSANLLGVHMAIPIGNNMVALAAKNYNAISFYDITGCAIATEVSPCDPTFITDIIDATDLDAPVNMYSYGRYLLVTVEHASKTTVIDIGGLDMLGGSFGTVATKDLVVEGRASFGGQVNFNSGMLVGNGGINLSGPINSTAGAIFIGKVGIGTTSPYAKLSVVGETVSSWFTATSTTATSTFPYFTATRGAITGLPNCDTIDSDANGYLKCGTDSIGTGSGTVSTSTVPIVGNLAYWTNAGTPSLLGTVATTSLTATSPLSLSQPISVIGSAASALTLSTAGDWAGTFDSQEGSYYLNAGNLTNFGTPFYTYFSATTTTALAEGTNLYYTDARVNSYIHASTTIPKLYTGNTFTGLQVFSNTGTTTFAGGLQGTYLNLTGITATSTFARGIDLTGGCFAINGTCVGGAGGSGTVGSGTTGQFPYYAANGTTLTATSSIFLATSGNVGIGTASPGYRLDVNGDTNLAAGSVYRIGGVAQSGSSKWTAGIGDDIYRSLGNVGIGTTSPYAKLSVWGGTTGNILEVITNASTTALFVSATGFATTTLMGLNINGSATSTSNVGWNITAGCFAINGTCVGGAGGSGTVGSGTTGQFPYYAANGTTLTATSSIFLATSGNVGIGTTTPWGLLSVNANALTAGTPQFVVGSSTATNFIVANNGYVGIGTASPEYRLDILDASNPQLGLINTAGSATTTFWTDNVGDLRISSSGGDIKALDENFWVCSGGACDGATAPAGKGNLIVETAVGIGTTSPYAKLSVVGETVSSWFTATSTTATSTFSSFVDIVGGGTNCLAYSGKCATPRWIAPYHGGFSITTGIIGTTTAGLTYNLEFESLVNTPIDQICYITGSATTTAPHVIVGVYGPIITEETILSAPLLVKSATTTVGIAAATPTCISFTTIANLGVGRYYMSILSPEGASYTRQPSMNVMPGWGQYFSGTGNDLPSIAPTPTNTGNLLPALKLRGFK